VIIRGIEGSNIFRDDKDCEHILSRVGEIGKATGPQILASTLMDDHVHMVLINQQLIGIPQQWIIVQIVRTVSLE
jgi:REP element-mobilizing transposase RayT